MPEVSEFLHKVHPEHLELFKNERVSELRGFCGTWFIPELPTNFKKPRCPKCFPPVRYPFAIAA